MGISDWNGKVVFVLAFAVVHGLPNAEKSFKAPSPAGKILFSEPSDITGDIEFRKFLAPTRNAGFSVAEKPAFPWDHIGTANQERFNTY